MKLIARSAQHEFSARRLGPATALSEPPFAGRQFACLLWNHSAERDVEAASALLGSLIHREGFLESQGAYLHDKKEGHWRYFSFEGKPSEEIVCRSGRAHGAYRRWGEFDLGAGGTTKHMLALNGELRDGQPIGGWWLSDPYSPPFKITCKPNESCEPPGTMLWSDVTRGCETIEFRLN
jgi:hypothetical protein